jgi:hypothetical protein
VEQRNDPSVGIQLAANFVHWSDVSNRNSLSNKTEHIFDNNRHSSTYISSLLSIRLYRLFTIYVLYRIENGSVISLLALESNSS